MANHGGKRAGAGRKPKADEQDLIERLTPLRAKAFSALDRALVNEEAWAIKLWMEYFYGKPKQTIKNEVTIEEKKRPEWFDESES